MLDKSDGPKTRNSHGIPCLSKPKDLRYTLQTGYPRKTFVPEHIHFSTYLLYTQFPLPSLTQRLIHTNVPTNPLTTPAVKIPAPACSPAVTVLVSKAGNACCVPPSCWPAPGSLLLVPPWFILTGPGTFCIKVDWIMLKALISSPTP